MEIVPLPCFHHFIDGHSPSLSLALSMQSPIDREISRSRRMEIVLFLCLHCFTDGHSLSLFLSLSLPLSMQFQYLESLLALNTPLTLPTLPDTPNGPYTPYEPPYAPNAHIPFWS